MEDLADEKEEYKEEEAKAKHFEYIVNYSTDIQTERVKANKNIEMIDEEKRELLYEADEEEYGEADFYEGREKSDSFQQSGGDVETMDVRYGYLDLDSQKFNSRNGEKGHSEFDLENNHECINLLEEE